MKAYAAWWLWVTLAGWVDPDITPTTPGYTPTNTSGLSFGLAFSMMITSIIFFIVVRTSYRKNRIF